MGAPDGVVTLRRRRSLLRGSGPVGTVTFRNRRGCAIRAALPFERELPARGRLRGRRCRIAF